MALEPKKRAIIERHGEWTNHNIRLDADTYTIGKEKLAGSEVKVRRMLQAVADLAGKPLNQLRVLDLACLEGLYGIEFALHGASVVGIEGREANLAKARFAAEALQLSNIEFFQDDVRNLSAEKYGMFDAVLCIGIYYHLDTPDLFAFTEKICEMTSRLAVFDTHVSFEGPEKREWKGKEYSGRGFEEHTENATAETKLNKLWASLDNPQSFWFTRDSFFRLLTDVGFTSVLEIHQPPVPKYESMRASREADRNGFVAIKGEKLQIKTFP